MHSAVRYSFPALVPKVRLSNSSWLRPTASWYWTARQFLPSPSQFYSILHPNGVLTLSSTLSIIDVDLYHLNCFCMSFVYSPFRADHNGLEEKCIACTYKREDQMAYKTTTITVFIISSAKIYPQNCWINVCIFWRAWSLNSGIWFWIYK